MALCWPTLQVLASLKMGPKNQNGIKSPERERGYCRYQKLDHIELDITSIPFTRSEIFPIKDHYPMTFSDY